MTELSNASWSIWGKMDPKTDEWLPLVTHLTDTMEMASWLWGNFLPGTIRERVATAAGGDEAGHSLLCLMASWHDLGKATPAFSLKAEQAMPVLVARMKRSGLPFPQTLPEKHRAKHATLGQVIVQEWLADTMGTDRRSTKPLGTIIGGHHGVFPTDTELRDARIRSDGMGGRPGTSERKVWDRVRGELLEHFLRASGADRFIEGWLSNPISTKVQVLVTGAVILADWLASDVENMPYDVPREQRLSHAVARVRFPGPWDATKDSNLSIEELFDSRFPKLAGLTPRPIQREVTQLAQQSNHAPLIIIEAPMGGGKTEAGLLASTVLAGKFGAGGIFLGLPTMATANPMFNKMLEFISSSSLGETSVYLAHSKSIHHDEFTALPRTSSFRGIAQDEETQESVAVVASWLTGRKRAGFANFVVGTVDQALLLALAAKHIVLRHLAFAGKVVVIDEVHSADDYMRVYLKQLLTWLGAHHTPTILMSATLPSQQRAEFVAAYAAGRDEPAPQLPTTTSYPLLTSYDGTLRQLAPASDTRTSKALLRPVVDDLDWLVAQIKVLSREGGCIGIIRNTVSRAQETADRLMAEFGDDVVLTHSRFITHHRATTERQLVELLGPGHQDRPKRLIVVGTQVLEQSLDIDFDLLVCDLAPMDLLLQRIGRLHRHDRPERPTDLKKPICLVTGCDWGEAPPVPIRGSQRIYGLDKLLASALLIGSGIEINLPADIPVLVNRAYDPDLEPPKAWEKAWQEAKVAARKRFNQKIERASVYAASPPKSQSLTGWPPATTKADPDDRKNAGKAHVRDIEEDSFEVVVMQRDHAGFLRLPDGVFNQEAIELSQLPTDPSLARKLASTTIGLPVQMARPAVWDDVEEALNNQITYEHWDQSPWLYGTLPLILSSDGTAQIADFHLTYSQRKGLLVTETTTTQEND